MKRATESDPRNNLSAVRGRINTAKGRAPEPDIHSYDPSPARRTVTVRWPDGQFLGYTLTCLRDGKCCPRRIKDRTHD